MLSGWVGDQDPTFEGLENALKRYLQSAWAGKGTQTTPTLLRSCTACPMSQHTMHTLVQYIYCAEVEYTDVYFKYTQESAGQCISTQQHAMHAFTLLHLRASTESVGLAIISS